MSTEHHNTDQDSGQPPRNSDVAFEPADIDTHTVLLYLFYLALAVAATFLISIYIFRFTTKLAVESDRGLPPMRQGVATALPPEPRLQGVPGSPMDPQEDLREKIAADEAANKQLKWVDQQAGIAQIPVDEAMKIIVAKGLSAVPALPPPPTTGKKR